MPDSEAPRIVLVGPAMAPPVDLSRWLMNDRSIPYQFVRRAPGLHAFASRRHAVPIELPLILTPAGAVGTLWNSLEWLDEQLAHRERLFETPEDRTFVQGLCVDLFGDAVKSFYSPMLGARRVLLSAALKGVPWADVLFARLLYPVWRGMMRAGLDLNAFDPDAAAARIDLVFARVEAELGDRAFLHGDAPGIRDIVFAALASPVVLPDGHPAPLPPVAELPNRLRALVERCRGRPAGLLAMRVYAQRSEAREFGKQPRDRPGVFAELKVKLTRIAFRFAAAILPRTMLVRGTLLVPRWQDVDELLRRDADFLIAPVNAERIAGVMGPFILGMDASAELHAQRGNNYTALHDADKSGIMQILTVEPARLAGDAARRFGKIDVVAGYARPIAARVAVSLFGIRGPTEQDLMRVARAIFHETFLNIGNDRAIQAAGRAAGAEMMAWINAEVDRRGGNYAEDVLGQLIRQAAAGRLAPGEIPWIAAGLLVGSIDTTAAVVANIVNEAVRDPALLAAMRRDRADRDLLSGWCWEALRRRPHNPAVLRQAGSDTLFAGRTVPAGTRVLAMTLSAMQDGRAFPHPAKLDPRRPLDLYMHFGRALHRCSGRTLNEVQIPVLVRTLLDHGLAGPADSRNRGPFPDRLVVTLGRRT